MHRNISDMRRPFTPTFRHMSNMLCDRVKVNGLPEEVNEKFLLYQLLLHGRCLLYKDGGSYHAFWFSGHGKKDEYLVSNEFLVANPYRANPDKTVFTPKNAVVLYSDINAYLFNEDFGLYEIVYKYSTIIDSIDKSIKALAVNSKLIAILTGNSKSFVESARRVIRELFSEDSTDCVAIMEESLVDNIRVNPLSDKMDYKLSELIKLRQYFVSDFLQKIGVAANQNMKAERLTDNESQLVESAANVDFRYILNNLNDSAKAANKLFGLNLSFELNEPEEKYYEEPEEEEESSQLEDGEKDDNTDKED